MIGRGSRLRASDSSKNASQLQRVWPLHILIRRSCVWERFLRMHRSLGTLDCDKAQSSLPGLFQAKIAIVLSDNGVALAGGVFKFLAVHDLHCATGVLDKLFPLQNTSCQARGRSICP